VCGVVDVSCTDALIERTPMASDDIAASIAQAARSLHETQSLDDSLVWTLDKIQYELGEGPCVESLRAAPVVAAPHLRHDQRWPSYVPRAVRAGLQSQLAIRLYLDDTGVLGGLNLYSTRSPDIDPEARSSADLFAAHAAIALGSASDRHHLNEALQTRKVVGQAIGIVMERYKLSEDRAFDFLVRASSQGNVRLRDVAQKLVDQGNDR
jgi:GAF domain-containing protein